MAIGKLTIAEVISSAPARFRSQYSDRLDLPTYTDPSRTWGEIAESLDKASGKKAMDAIIGNSSWTSLRCDECNSDVGEVAIFDVNYGEYSLNLCKDCCASVWGGQ